MEESELLGIWGAKAPDEVYRAEESEQYGKAQKFFGKIVDDPELGVLQCIGKIRTVPSRELYRRSILKGAKSQDDCLSRLIREQAAMEARTRMKQRMLEEKDEMMTRISLVSNSSYRGKKHAVYVYTRRELEQLKSLQHPNILQFYGSSPDGFYTECSGTGTIQDYNEKGGKHKQYLLLWARDAAAGLCYLYERGIFQRDVSPKKDYLETKTSLSTFSYAILLYLLIFTKSGDKFAYDKRPNLENLERQKVEDEDGADRLLKKVVAACGRCDPARRPAMSKVLTFILYHAPELTRFPIKDPVEL